MFARRPVCWLVLPGRRELATSFELGVAAHCAAAAVAPLLLPLLLPLLPVFVAVNVHVFTVHGAAFTP